MRRSTIFSGMSLLLMLALFASLNLPVLAQVPISESFDGTTFPPAGWLNPTTSPTWSRVTTNTYPPIGPHTGAGMAKFNSYSVSSGTAPLITSSFDLSQRGTNTPTVTFWMYRDDMYLGTADKLDVYINTTASATGGTLLGTINRPRDLTPVVATIGWYQYSFNIPAGFNTATNYLVFLGTSQYGSDIFLDDVSYVTYPAPNAPNCAITPVPANSATAVLRNSTLSWVNGGGASNYDVYFGTSSTPPLVTNVTSTSYTPPTMAANTQYYWKIVAKNPFGSAVGCSTWSFTTGSGFNYCPSVAYSTVDDDIGNVTISNLNNGVATPALNNPLSIQQYTDFTALPPAQLQLGNVYPISVSQINSAGFYTCWVNVFIDYNQDGTFDPVTERVFNGVTVTPTGTVPNPTTGTVSIPGTALLGTTRMRVMLREGGTATDDPCLTGTNLYYGETEDYTVQILPGAPQTYVSSTVNQPNVSPVPRNTTNQEVLQIVVNMNGSSSPMQATSFTLNTNGTTNPTINITNAKLWYTTTPTFATTTQFGSSVAAPNGAFTITGSQSLVAGNNYFWLTYDVPSTATVGALIDGECSSITIGGTPRTPTTMAPAGNRTIYTLYGTLPYFQSFDATWVNKNGTRDVPDLSWINTPATGNQSWRRQDDYLGGGWSSNSGAITPFAGTGAARFHSYDASSSTTGAFDLYLDFSTTGPKTLVFRYINTSGSDNLQVLLSTNGGSTFGTALTTLTTAAAWTQQVVLLGNVNVPQAVVRFLATSDYGVTDIGVDEVVVGANLLEKDVQVLQAFIRNADNLWARAATKSHAVQAVIKNLGYEANPTSVTLVYKLGSAPTSSTDGVSQTFAPAWNGNTAVCTFTTKFVPPSTGAYTVYVRSFYTGDGSSLNDQASNAQTVQDVKIFGFEDFLNFVLPGFTYGPNLPVDPWTVVNNGGTPTWVTQAGVGMSASNALVYPGDVAQANDWIVAPAATLAAGSSYRVRAKVKSSSGAMQTMQFYYGTSADVATMTPVTEGLFTTNSTTFVDTRNTVTTAWPYFNTTVAGPYYVAIKITSAANAGAFVVDDLTLDVNPAPPPKIGYRYEASATFVDDPASANITVKAVYKTPGTVTRRYEVSNTTNLYGSNGDFLWDVTTTTPWLTITKDAAAPTAQPTNPFTPPRPRQGQYFVLEFDPTGLNPGTYTGSITFQAKLFNDDYPPTGPGLNATNAPFTVPVVLTVDASGTASGPAVNVAVLAANLAAPNSALMTDATGRLIAKLTSTNGTIPAGFTITEYPNQLPLGYTRLKYVRKYWTFSNFGSGWTGDVEFYYTDTEAMAGGVTMRQNLRGRRQPTPGGYLWQYAGNPATNAGSASLPGTNSVVIYGLNPSILTGNFAVATNWDNSAKAPGDGTQPVSFALDQNYPNPFNPSTTIRFSIPEDTHVSLVIYNAMGAEVVRLNDGVLPAGQHRVTFDASNLPSGTYTYRLTAGSFMATKTMTLMK